MKTVYKYFDVEVKLETLWDIKEVVNIYLDLISSYDKNELIGHNFNKYYEKEGAKPRISVRLNLNMSELEKVVVKKAEELVNLGKIVEFDRNLHAWNEPEFVAKAHEIGTACTLRLKELMDRNPEIYKKFLTRKPQFMVHLASLTLNKIGFDFHIIWALLRDSPVKTAEIDSIAEELAKVFLATTEDDDINSDYLERFVHAFFNCSESSNSDRLFYDWAITSQFWNALAKSYKK